MGLTLLVVLAPPVGFGRRASKRRGSRIPWRRDAKKIGRATDGEIEHPIYPALEDEGSGV
jgi:hypothetical protein